MTEPKFKVGDVVFVSTYGRPYSSSVVKSVGRKYLTVDGTKFRISDGNLASEYTGKVLTAREYETMSTINQLHKALRSKRVDVNGSFSIDQLERMLAIASEDA